VSVEEKPFDDDLTKVVKHNEVINLTVRDGIFRRDFRFRVTDMFIRDGRWYAEITPDAELFLSGREYANLARKDHHSRIGRREAMKT